jgi:hypothetical protein
LAQRLANVAQWRGFLTTSYFMIYNPQTILLDEVEQNQRKAQEQYAREDDDHNDGLLETAFLDFDKSDESFRNMRQGLQDVGYDAEEAKKRAQLDSFMYLQTQKAGIDAKPQDFKIYQDQYAKQYFNGVGVGDDNAFHGEVVKHFTKRKNGREFNESLVGAALDNESLKGADFFDSNIKTFQAWKQENATHPGYDQKNEAQYLQRWNKAQKMQAERIEEFRNPLNSVWQAFKNDGDVRLAASNAYFSTPTEKQTEFLYALKARAAALPKDQQATFWNNLTKQGWRDTKGIGTNTLDFLDEFMGGTAAMNAPDNAGIVANEKMRIEERDFIADVKRVRESTYDPVKSVLGADASETWKAIEHGAYAAPGALATSATAMIPFLGVGITYAHMQQSAYQDLRWKMLDAGVSRDDAASQAQVIAPIIALPQAVLEKVGSRVLTGKLPFFNAALTKVANKIGGGMLGAAFRVGASAVQETAIEMTQDYWSLAVQDMANGISEDLPNVQWLGEGGVWDGAWSQGVSTFVAVLPLSLFAGAGQINVDERARAFANASDSELRAFGGTDETIAALREAEKQGIASTHAAIEKLLETRDPNSETAIAAVEEIKAKEDAQRALVEAAQKAGIQPFMTVNPDKTITLRDSVTNDEIATVQTAEEATAVMTDYVKFKEEHHAQAVAEMGAMLETMQAQATTGEGTGRAVQFNYRPLDFRSAQSEIDADPTSAKRVFKQLGIVEGTEHGVDLSKSFINGFSENEFLDGIHTTTNTILGNGTVTTTFHEDAHGLRRAAMRKGSFPLAEQIQAIRAIDRAMSKQGGKTVPKLFLGDALTDEDVTETMLDEAFAELMESEVLRVTKLGGKANSRANLSAYRAAGKAIDAAMIAEPESRGVLAKIKGMIRYMQAMYGEVFNRAISIRKAIARGDINEGEYHAMLDKLMGREDTTTAEQEAVVVASEIIDGVERVTFEDGSEMDVPFSISKGENDAWEKQLESYFENPQTREMLTVGSVPKVLLAVGVSEAKMLMPPSVIRKVTVDKHSLTREMIEQIPAAMHDPIFVFNSATEADAITIITDVKSNGSNVLVALHLDQPAPRQKANLILSLYEKSPTSVQGWIKDGMLLYAHTKKARSYFQSARLQLPREGSKAGNKNLLTENDIVNEENSNDEKQFSISRNVSHSKQLSVLQAAALKFAKDPEQLRAMAERASRTFERLRRDTARSKTAFGKDYKTKVLDEERARKSINKEAAMRQAIRRQELEDEAYMKHNGMIDQPELTKLKNMPIHSVVADPRNPLKGRIRSRGATAAMQGDMLEEANLADYDGADGLNKTIFGGSTAPDQMANELFENGLLREPTTDALWEALRKEQNSVDGMKEMMHKAKADFAEAKRTARDEAKAWTEQKLKEQKLDHSIHAKIIRAFGMLDGILYALPPEVRGKVGIHTATLAKIKGDQARLDYLESAMTKAGEAMETHLSKIYDKAWKKLIKKSQPKGEAGEKAKGKLGAEAHRFFAQVSAVAGMTEREVDAAMKMLDEDMLLPANQTPEKLADIAEEFQILMNYGNFKGKDAKTKGDALKRAENVFETGRNSWRLTEEARLAGVKEAVENAIADLGSGTLADVQRRKKAAQKATEQITVGRWTLKSFAEVMDGMFGENSATTKNFVGKVRRAFTARTKAVIEAEREWKKTIELATGKKGREARKAVWEMQTEQTMTLTIAPFSTQTIEVPIDTFFDAAKQKSLGLSSKEISELTTQFEALPEGSARKYLRLERVIPGTQEQASYTEAEAIHLSMLWAQEGYKAGLAQNGFGEAFQEELENRLSAGAKAIRNFLAEKYESNFEPMRALYAQMYGIDLQKAENYAPGTFYSMGTGDTSIDPHSGVVSGGSFRESFLKTRKSHTATPRAENAFDIYFSHMNQAEHWKALAEVSRELHGVMGNPDVKIALQAKTQDGAFAVNKWLEVIDGNGIALARPSPIMAFLMSSQAYGALAWKMGTMLKNGLGAMTNMAYHMPLGDFLKGWGRLVSGKIDFATTWESDAIQNRLHGGFSPEMKAAISQALFGKPSMRGDFLLAGMEIHAKADAFGSAIGAAICYDYHYRKAIAEGASEEAAKAIALDEAAEGVSRTSQPSDVVNRSLFELNMNPAGKLMFLFASEARQKSSMYLTAMGRTLTGKATKKDVKVIMLAHLIVAPLMQLITAAVRDATNDDDDELFDDKYWNPKDFLLAMATGPAGGIPYLRDALELLKGYRSGTSSNPVANTAGALMETVKEAMKDGDMEWNEKKVTQIMQAMGGSPAAAANIYKQLVGAARNVIPD